MDELVSLRVSVARIAQAAGVDNHLAPLGVMCGGTAEAAAADNLDARLAAIPTMPREYVDCTPAAKERLQHKSSRELFMQVDGDFVAPDTMLVLE